MRFTVLTITNGFIMIWRFFRPYSCDFAILQMILLVEIAHRKRDWAPIPLLSNVHIALSLMHLPFSLFINNFLPDLASCQAYILYQGHCPSDDFSAGEIWCAACGRIVCWWCDCTHWSTRIELRLRTQFGKRHHKKCIQAQVWSV